jgi:hypothetical protein
MKRGTPLAIVDPRGTSSECPKCDSKLEENEYRRLRCPQCNFEADRNVVGKLNIRKKALKMLRIKQIPGKLCPSLPPDDICTPEQMREPMNRPEGTLALQGGEEVSGITIPGSACPPMGIECCLFSFVSRLLCFLIHRVSMVSLWPSGASSHSTFWAICPKRLLGRAVKPSGTVLLFTFGSRGSIREEPPSRASALRNSKNHRIPRVSIYQAHIGYCLIIKIARD